MSAGIAHRAELEARFKGVEEETEREDLADDVIFEPSLVYEGRKVAIAVKDGIQVCWCCFEPVTANECLDALMGEGGVVVRICRGDESCRKKVGADNRQRDSERRKGNIIMLDGLSENERTELVQEIKEKKSRFRGF